VRIGIDASRTTVARVTGTEHYALELIRAIIRHNTTHDLTLYFRDDPAPSLFPKSDHVTHKVIPFSRLWTHLRFAAALWRDRPDVTVVPAHTLPFFFPGKALVTVHDLGYKLFPEAHPAKQRFYLDLTTWVSARRATVILADSQATADDLTRFYKTNPQKIRVVYPGVEKPDVRARHDLILPERYFLFIGTLQPRKNIARIVQAYAQYRQSTANPAALVLAGGKGWLYDDHWVEGIDGVYLPGYIDEADKGALMAGALALVFPTLYEGFGFPVIEAMHCGTPVIASNTSSLPELVGDAGIQVNPLDVAAIAEAMQMLAGDEALRAQLRERGLEQARQFTWDNAAQQFLQVLETI
jgi:glycosyltransferase involved in cell wall biosynthesis